jgi:hypothetical protein
MILPVINKSVPRHRRSSGYTLIEALTVISVVAVLIATVGASLVLVLKSYVGEFRTDALELEAQRAVLELEYYAARAVKVEIFDDSVLSNAGSQVILHQYDGTVVAFDYLPDPARSPMAFVPGDEEIGELAILLTGPDREYVYSRNIRFLPTDDSRFPFWRTANGGLGYRWHIETASGPNFMGGATFPAF